MTFPVEEILHYPDAFIYYDKDSMMFFDKNDPSPKRIYDYTKVTPENINDHSLPRSEDKGAVTVTKLQTDDGYQFNIVIRAKETIPYGVALWGDYSGYQITCDEGFTAKTLGKEMVFIVMTAHPGETRFSLYATGKSVNA